jgi:hypothetical protein
LNNLIDRALNEIQADPTHHLNPVIRLAICQSLGQSVDLSGRRYLQLNNTGEYEQTADHFKYSQLAIQTAKHVVLTWKNGIKVVSSNREDSVRNLCDRILLVAGAVSHGEFNPTEANTVYLDEFYHLLGSVAFSVTYETLCAANAAYSALGMTLGIEPFRYRPIDDGITDDMLGDSGGDVGTAASRAYSAIDYRNPGEWVHAKSGEPVAKIEPWKRLGFWNWWLIVAVLAAMHINNS